MVFGGWNSVRGFFFKDFLYEIPREQGLPDQRRISRGLIVPLDGSFGWYTKTRMSE
jgi:hypothetical protein